MNSTHIEIKNEAVQRRRYRLLLAGMLILLFAVVLLSFYIGYYPLSPSQVIKAFLSRFGYEGEILPQAVTIFWSIRLPRILSAVFIGASLSVAGSTYQGMFRNPLVSPDILGVSSGASLARPLHSNGRRTGWCDICFCGGVTCTATYLISRKSHILLESWFLPQSCPSVMRCHIQNVLIPTMFTNHLWLMGSLTKTTWTRSNGVLFPWLLPCSYFYFRWQINLLR